MKIETGIKVIGIMILLAGIGAYQYYTWSDCLEENSVLTCMRMLNN